ncbi:membrane protein insertase YidC, partial [Candidatus Saccharibacteria bacterium]|nr:membrane protein insertase YidC [Candidatus Saccharibacteria bacterium]
MKNWSVKKTIIWGLILLFVVGSIAAGGPFNLIDIIIVRPIVNIQFMIFNLVHDFGVAIIIFAVLVKLCMLPLTKRQLMQTRLMRKIQPELTQIRKNCNGNKQLESIQTMDLYKRYNVKPFSSILTLLIQLPIFIAIFSAIRVIATPMPTDNLMNRAYEIVAYEGSEIRTLEEKQEVYLADLNNSEIPAEEKAEYDFHPQLFGVIDLTARASDVISPSKFSWSAVFMLVMAIGA